MRVRFGKIGVLPNARIGCKDGIVLSWRQQLGLLQDVVKNMVMRNSFQNQSAVFFLSVLIISPYILATQSLISKFIRCISSVVINRTIISCAFVNLRFHE